MAPTTTKERNTMATKLSATDMFETTACSRCGGCGRYSWNARTGSVCFKCNGTGWQYTKAGKAARDAWVAAYTVMVPVEDLQPGDEVMLAGVLGSSREQLHVVAASNPDPLNQGHWQLKFSSGPLGGYHPYMGSSLRKPASREMKAAAYAKVAHMPGALLASL